MADRDDHWLEKPVEEIVFKKLVTKAPLLARSAPVLPLNENAQL
jgi:hypothetical protein